MDIGTHGFWYALVAMTAATYGIRAGGFALMRYVPLTPFVRRMLETLPGAVIVATVLPIVGREGTPAMLGIVAAVLVMVWRRSDWLAVLAGMAVAAAARACGL